MHTLLLGLILAVKMARETGDEVPTHVDETDGSGHVNINVTGDNSGTCTCTGTVH